MTAHLWTISSVVFHSFHSPLPIWHLLELLKWLLSFASLPTFTAQALRSCAASVASQVWFQEIGEVSVLIPWSHQHCEWSEKFNHFHGISYRSHVHHVHPLPAGGRHGCSAQQLGSNDAVETTPHSIAQVQLGQGFAAVHTASLLLYVNICKYCRVVDSYEIVQKRVGLKTIYLSSWSKCLTLQSQLMRLEKSQWKYIALLKMFDDCSCVCEECCKLKIQKTELEIWKSIQLWNLLSISSILNSYITRKPLHLVCLCLLAKCHLCRPRGCTDL